MANHITESIKYHAFITSKNIPKPITISGSIIIRNTDIICLISFVRLNSIGHQIFKQYFVRVIIHVLFKHYLWIK